jgi:hypothetical protein
MDLSNPWINFKWLSIAAFWTRVSHFSPFVNFETSFDKEFDTGTKIFVEKVLMEFNNASKIGFRTQIRQCVPEIYQFSHRKPHKLKILNVKEIFLFKERPITLFIKNVKKCKIQSFTFQNQIKKFG